MKLQYIFYVEFTIYTDDSNIHKLHNVTSFHYKMVWYGISLSCFPISRPAILMTQIWLIFPMYQLWKFHYSQKQNNFQAIQITG